MKGLATLFMSEFYYPTCNMRALLGKSPGGKSTLAGELYHAES
jgi:hypothetical protein